MSSEFMDWELIPEGVFQAFQRRLELVELLLDPTVDSDTKGEERRRYREEHRVGDRTIRNYLHRYRKKGPRGLLFYRPRHPCPRIPDQQLREKILQLVHELPTRSVPKNCPVLRPSASAIGLSSPSSASIVNALNFSSSGRAA